MKQYVDLLFESIIKHDPSILPLADIYAATEDGHPAALCMMTSFKTITGLNKISICAIDEVEGQIVVTSNVDESGMPIVFFARIKIEKEKITELEFYLVRSRGDSGFWCAPEDMGKEQPAGWSSMIPEDGKATREELLQLGKAIFDSSIVSEYKSAPDLILMELGGVVYESPVYSYALNPDAFEKEPEPTDPREPIPFGIPPQRPCDSNARVVVVDENQGIVVTIGMIEGYVSPYIVPDENSSCFVPGSLMEMHRNSLKDELFIGKKAAKEMPASAITMTVNRYHSGMVQGYHQYILMQSPGARSVWAEK